MMSCKRELICLSCVWLLHLITFAAGTSARDTFEDHVDGISTITSVTVACLSVVILVFLISLCGGCTPMEVGSEDHAAAGGIKHGGNHGQYDSVASDANTRVMHAGTTMPNDPYEHQDHALPYDLHPAGSPTAQNFTGYTPVHQPTGMGQGQMGAMPAYGQPLPTYGQPNAATNQTSYQGSHRPAFSSEPPPPGYDEATRPTAPAQSYGW